MPIDYTRREPRRAGPTPDVGWADPPALPPIDPPRDPAPEQLRIGSAAAADALIAEALGGLSVPFETTADGFVIRNGQVPCIIRAAPWNDGRDVVVLIVAVALVDIDPTSDLGALLAFLNGRTLFGGWAMNTNADGRTDVSLDYGLLATWLDVRTLRSAIVMISDTATKAAPQLQDSSGGKHSALIWA